MEDDRTQQAMLDAFRRRVDAVRARSDYREPIAFGLGVPVYATHSISLPVLASMRYVVMRRTEDALGTFAALFEALRLGPYHDNPRIIRPVTHEEIDSTLRFLAPLPSEHPEYHTVKVLKRARQLTDRTPVVYAAMYANGLAATLLSGWSIESATFMLYALSHRIVRPRDVDLEGVLGALPQMTWIGDRPYTVDACDDMMLDAAFGEGSYDPDNNDKVPYYLPRVNATRLGVRIVDAAKARLGAYLGVGTTIMPGASYVNFGAGGEGNNMIEGRVSSGAWIGRNTSVGGGASIAGILSGGNTTPVTIGAFSQLDANCSVAASIGNACIVTPNCSITASMPVFVHVPNHPLNGRWVRVEALSGTDGITFWTNRRTGRFEAVRTINQTDDQPEGRNEKLIAQARAAGIDLHLNGQGNA